jgi:hypothetical protein
VNATYIGLIWELVNREDALPRVRRIMRIRSIVTLCLFAIVSVIALKLPLVGLGICIICLIVYLRPAPAGSPEQALPTTAR